ncbi:MAG TPA: glycosyltransferase family 2 protein, partial [Myxococcota bacterium]|nr:glycosyltransferase family 2 protein [Myxococcota bacterium]
MPLPKISILVVSYNAREVLASCLASLGGEAEVIVVDNHSPDDSVSHVREHFPNVQLVALPDNRGFSAAVNEAARRATGDAFLLLNPDAEVPPRGLGAMARALVAHPDAWAVGFRQVDEGGRFQLAVGPQPTLPGELLRKVIQRRLDAGSHWMGRALDGLMRRSVKVPWVAGSSLLVWRHAFERVGGFDERYFLYFEDIDFCLRLRRAGGEVYYDPSVTVMHRRGVSAAKSPGLASRAYRESQ